MAPNGMVQKQLAAFLKKHMQEAVKWNKLYKETFKHAQQSGLQGSLHIFVAF